MKYSGKFSVKTLAEASKIPLEDLALCSVEQLENLAISLGQHITAKSKFETDTIVLKAKISDLKKK